jgi:imidazolonepropionase-like amidohydrolase
MSSGGIGGMPEREHPNWAELSEEEIAAAVFAAHTHKREVTVHAMGIEPVLAALHAGVDGIEHGTMLNEEALDIMEKRHVYYVPTASGITAVANKEAAQGSAELAATIRELVVNPQRESIKKAKARGILIGAGSDTLGSVLNELLIFEECGFTRKECLDAATCNAAKILHLEDRLGYVREGYIADLVLVDGNPLEDLHNLSNVRKVFKGGNEVTLEWLMNLQ